jgi:glyoxylase-like metal-dependent hydrolase (beta-lactamase superfamily II)
MVLPEHEIYAIRYATVERRARENFLAPPLDDRAMPMDYFVWAIRGGGSLVVVDTGFGSMAAEKRRRRLLRSPAAGLASLGIDAARVPDVVLTHLHYDHAGNLDLFPCARFHVQDREVSFATGRAMAHDVLRHPFDASDVALVLRNVFAGRVRFHDGDATLAPGITLHRVGGHTRGMQIVRVHTARGWVVLASDASHYRANFATGNPFPLLCDLEEVLEGYRMLRALATSEEHVVPGHDPDVLSRYRGLQGDPDIACIHEAPRQASGLP